MNRILTGVTETLYLDSTKKFVWAEMYVIYFPLSFIYFLSIANHFSFTLHYTFFLKKENSVFITFCPIYFPLIFKEPQLERKGKKTKKGEKYQLRGKKGTNIR